MLGVTPTLDTGEAPLARIERAIATNWLMRTAVLFGHEQDSIGALVEPFPADASPSSNPSALATFRDQMWPLIEDANQVIPIASRISKEMILIASPEKPLPRTSSGVIIRKAALDLYKNEITKLYTTLSGSKKQSHVHTIQQMIEDFSANMPVIDAPEEAPVPKQRTVLITGTTGGLGSQLLAMCLVDASIERVYALNRPSARSSIADRHAYTFRDRGMDMSLLASKKLVYLEGDMRSEWLGLGRETYEDVRSKVTTIIHNAWRLGLTLPRASFVPNVQGTRNLIDFALTSPNSRLIRFLFTSTIAVGMSWPAKRGPLPEEPIMEPEAAVGNGYGECKYVAEQLLVKAAERGLQTTSFRIGQISGGYANGAWATTDWVPIFVKSGIALGCLPDAYGLVSWTPFDVVAQTILEAAAAEGDLGRALNVVHPHPVTWRSVFEHIAEALVDEGVVESRLPLVPFGEWFGKVQVASNDAGKSVVSRIPATQLVEFFKHRNEADQVLSAAGNPQVDAGGLPIASTCRAESVSPTLRDSPPLDARDVRRWVRYWIEKGYLVSPATKSGPQSKL